MSSRTPFSLDKMNPKKLSNGQLKTLIEWKKLRIDVHDTVTKGTPTGIYGLEVHKLERLLAYREKHATYFRVRRIVRIAFWSILIPVGGLLFGIVLHILYSNGLR